VAGNAVRERSKLRRGALRLADDAGRRCRAFELHHVQCKVRDLLAASRQHHAHGVDEADTRTIDDRRGRVFQVEAGDVFGDHLRELLGVRARPRRTLCLRRTGEAGRGQRAQRQCTRAEKPSAIDGVCGVTILHVLPSPCCERVSRFLPVEVKS
jgi:hypothetical protein